MFEQVTSGVSCWTSTTRQPIYPALHTQVDVDVVVVGGGITGITAAYLLKQRGKRVALLERHRCVSGQSGRTTAHLTAVTDVPLSRLVERIGVESTRVLWGAGAAAIARIRGVVRDERINCDFGWVRGCLYAPVGQDATSARLALSHEATVANALGIAATYVDNVGGLGRPGVWFEGQARMHPAHYLGVLLDRIDGDGSYVFEGTEVDPLDPNRLEVRANGITLHPEFIVAATHVPIVRESSDNRPPLSLDLATSYVISGTAQSGALDEGLYWEHRDASYEYLRIDRHEHGDTVIFGGMDHAGTEAAAASDRFARLERCLSQYVPAVRVVHRWSGLVAESADGRPYIGEIADGLFTATGFGGNGMTYGTLAGMMAADAACGERSPWLDVFDPRRASVVAGPWIPTLSAREAS